MLILQILFSYLFLFNNFIAHFMNIEQYPLLRYIINKYTYSIYNSEELIIFNIIGYFS